MIPIAAPRRLHRRHRAHQHRAVAHEQDPPGATSSARSSRVPLFGHAVAAGQRRAAGAGDRRREGRGGARARRRRARDGGRTTRPASTRRFRRCRTTRVVASWKTRAAGAARRDLHRTRLRARDEAHRRDPRARAAQPRVRRTCTCTPATATCTPTSRSIPTITRCCRRPTPRWRASWRSRGSLDGVISGEHGIGMTKLEYLTDEELAPFAAVQARGRSARAASTAASCCAIRRAGRLVACVHAELLAHRPREPDPRAERHRRRSRLDQGLPALRQMQAGVRHARAARESPLQPAQQDPRDIASDRGLPVRGADAPRHEHQALQRVRRRCRPLHGLPQVRDPVPRRHRFRRRVDRDAQSAAQARHAQLQSRHGGVDVLPQRDQPDDDQGHEEGDDRLGLQGAARSRIASRKRPGIAQSADAASAADGGQASGDAASDPLHQQADAGQSAQAHVARAARHRGRGDRPGHPRSGEGRRRRRGGVLFSRMRLRAALLAGGARDAGDALSRRRADGAAAGLPLLRLSADRGRQPRRRAADHDRQPRAVPSCGQHAQLSRHQDRDRVLRHLHGSAAEVRVRQDLSGLPTARHPRVPDGKGRARSKA